MAKAAAAVGRKQVQSLIKKVLCVTLSRRCYFWKWGILRRIPYHISNVNDITSSILWRLLTCFQNNNAVFGLKS